MDVFSLFAKLSLDSSEYEQGLNDAEKKGSSFGTSLKNGLGTAAKVGGAALVAAGTAVTALVKGSVENYAEYEQLVGGVETLFKNSADTVQKYAAVAYKTAGLSANEYMTTVTSFSASLLQSLGGDTAEAAKIADMAIIDMSDNANKMGSDMASIQVAYQGFAKQNYTMLDNLKLGYGGTKTEMERLITDAEALDSTFKAVRDENGGLAMSYADVVNAIHIVQTSMDITGTTAKEASTTIQGSLSAVKSSWSNLIVGIADENANFDRLINDFVDSTATVAENLLPRIGQALMGIGELIERLAPVILDALPTLISEVLPSLLDSAVSLLRTVVQAIVDNLPMLLQTAADLVMELATGIAQALPDLIPTIVNVVLQIVDTLIDNVDLLVDGAIAIIMGLAEGLINALPILIEKIPGIIGKIVEALINNLPKLIEGMIQLVVMLVTHLPEIIMALIEAIPQIIVSILKAFGPIGEGLINLFSAAWDGIKNVFSSVGSWFSEKFSAAKEKVSEIWGGVKDTFSKSWENTKTVYANIGSWFKDKFTEARENSTNVWSNIKEKFSGIWDKIKSAFKFGDALQWGKDMINNFVDGIKAMLGKVKDTVSNVAKTVKDFLGFSEPDKGPLSNFHTFAPDMMKLFAQGIADNEDLVTNQIEKSFDFGSHTIKAATNIGVTSSVDKHDDLALVISDAVKEALEGFEIDWNGREIGRLIQKYA